MSRRRLSKKQLKQDKFVSTTFEMAQFAKEHARKVIVASIALVILLVGSLYYWNYRSHLEIRAANLLMGAQAAYDAGNYQLAITDLEKFEAEFSGTKRADEALFVLANAHFRTASYDSARTVLQRFVSRYSDDSPFSSQAYYLLGCTLENLQAYADAASAYLRAADCARFDYERARFRMAAARAFHEAGRDDEAEGQYRRVLDDSPDELDASRAALLLSEIEASDALPQEVE